MIDFNIAINLIKRNGGFKPNRHEDSFYRTYITQENRPLQVRISNHGTHLWTWYDKGYDPAYAINTCVVYSKDGTHNSNVEVNINIKDKYNNIIGQRKSFEVIQYVYNCQLLDENDSALINQAVQSIWQNKGYNDPLANTPKHAKVYRLRPNQAIETIVENKQYDNKNENMKQIVKLTESDLHRVIKESVKKILQENDFHRAYKNGKNLNVGIGDTYTDNEVFECLEELQEKLRQAKERALTGRYDEGASMNYLVGAIRGLQAFIDSHY